MNWKELKLVKPGDILLLATQHMYCTQTYENSTFTKIGIRAQPVEFVNGTMVVEGVGRWLTAYQMKLLKKVG